MSNQPINHSNSVSKQLPQDSPPRERSVASNTSNMMSTNYHRGFMGSQFRLSSMQPGEPDQARSSRTSREWKTGTSRPTPTATTT